VVKLKNKCAIYARVSTDRQAESVTHQVSLLREYAKVRGLGEVPDDCIYEDTGFSAYSLDIWARPAMKRLLQDAERGKFNVVLFKGISRLARNTQEALETLARLKYKGLRVISYEENYDSSRQDSSFAFTIHSAVAEYEAEKIAIRVLLGKKEAAKTGKWNGRPPFGYTVNEDARLQVFEEEAKYVRKMFHWYVNEGMGMAKIAQRLNELGIRTKFGSIWRKNSVKQVLTNETYLGRVVYNKRRQTRIKDYTDSERGRKRIVYTDKEEKEWIVCENAHEPIVEKEIFQEAQRLMKSRHGTSWVKPGGKPGQYPLSGILFCGECGGIFYHHRRQYTRVSKKSVARYYVCCNTPQFKDQPYVTCSAPSIRAERIEEYVVTLLRRRLKQALKKGDIFSHLSTNGMKKDDLKQKIREVDQKINKINEKTAELYFEKENMMPEQYNYLLKRLKGELEKLVIERGELEREKLLVEGHESQKKLLMKDIEEFMELDINNLGRLRVILSKFIERIDYKDGHLRIKYKFSR
jgi:site-specific DNA recombinase